MSRQNLRKKQKKIRSFCRNNLSPQGDGNTIGAANAFAATRNNLSPQGDGNRQNLTYKPTFGETTYPRKGTVTLSNCFLFEFAGWKQLIPARGR